MSNLSNFRPSRENKGVDIKTVRCDTYSSSFESLYNVYTTYCEEHPNGSWFPEFQRGLVNALQVLFELTGGRFYEFDLKYDFTKSKLTFEFNQFQVVVIVISSLKIDRVEVSKKVTGSQASKFNLGCDGLVLDFSNFSNDPLTATISVPFKVYSNSAVITKVNEAMEKIDNFLDSAKIPV